MEAWTLVQGSNSRSDFSLSDRVKFYNFIMNSTYNSKRHVFLIFAEKLDFFDQQLFES